MILAVTISLLVPFLILQQNSLIILKSSSKPVPLTFYTNKLLDNISYQVFFFYFCFINILLLVPMPTSLKQEILYSN